MAHDHNIIDDDNQFTIDGVHRQVTNATGNRPSVQQFDHNCERLTFQMPRFVDGHDMMLCDRVEIHYTNTGRGTSVSNRPVVASIDTVEDLAISEDDENLLTFSWLIPDTATQYAGTLVFQFKFICNGETEDDPPAFVWHTAQYSFVDVFASLNITDVIVDGYPDLLAKLCTKVDNFALDIDSFRNDKLDSKDAANTYATISSHIELRDATQEALNAHSGNKENPHGVTLDQLGVDASAAELNQMLGGVETPIQSQLDEKVIKGTSVMNSETAHVKPVPATAAPYAKVLEIGGKTRKCTNLLAYPYMSTTKTVNGVTYTDNGDGSISFSGTPTDYSDFTLQKMEQFTKGVYYISMLGDYEGVDIFIQFIGGGAVIGSKTYTASGLINTNDYPEATAIDFRAKRRDKGAACSGTMRIMLNSGSTPLPYEPYFSGLRSAAVSEVESVGANIFGGEALADKLVELGGTKDTTNKTVTITASAIGNNVLFDRFKQSRRYVFVFEGYNTSGSISTNLGVHFSDGTSSFPTFTDGKFSIATGPGKTITKLSGVWNTGSTVLNYEKCGIFEGALPAEGFKPYTRRTLPIPAAVQALDGYGWGVSDTCYNYIDYEKKQFVKRVERVDLGTLEWSGCTHQGPAGLGICTIESLPRKYGTGVGTLLCSKYESVHSVYELTEWTIAPYDALNDNHIYIADMELWLEEPDVIKSSLAGVMLYYELAEPVITDISDLLPTDNYVGVESGGTVTFVNEYGYDVPSKVYFYEDTNEIVGANTFVGNLEGTAARAEADADGKQLASREWVLEQIAAMIAQSTST